MSYKITYKKRPEWMLKLPFVKNAYYGLKHVYVKPGIKFINYTDEAHRQELEFKASLTLGELKRDLKVLEAKFEIGNMLLSAKEFEVCKKVFEGVFLEIETYIDFLKK